MFDRESPKSKDQKMQKEDKNQERDFERDGDLPDIDAAEAIAACRRIRNREISSKHRENVLDLGNPDGAMRVRMHKQSVIVIRDPR